MQNKGKGGETYAFAMKKEFDVESLRILRSFISNMVDSVTTQNEDTCIVQQTVRYHVASM